MTGDQTLEEVLEEGEEELELPSEEAKEALEKVKPYLAALPEKELKQPRVAGARAVAYAIRMQEMLDMAMPALREIFKVLPEEELGRLKTAALAFWSTQRAVELVDPSSKSSRQSYLKAGELKELVIQVLQFVGRGDSEVSRVLAVVKPGTGYVDRANDLLDLHTAIKKYQADILKKELLSAEQIEAMPTMAEQLLAPSQETANIATLRQMRDRAWSYFFHLHQEADRHLRFLYAYEPDKISALPALFIRKQNKKKKE
jgi:hypothetical protein